MHSNRTSYSGQSRYLQHHVIKALQQLPDFAAVKRLKIVIETQPKPKTISHEVIKALQQLPDFAAVKRLKIVIETQPKPKNISHGRLPALTPEIRQILDDAASAFQDTDISESLRRLAREQR